MLNNTLVKAVTGGVACVPASVEPAKRYVIDTGLALVGGRHVAGVLTRTVVSGALALWGQP